MDVVKLIITLSHIRGLNLEKKYSFPANQLHHTFSVLLSERQKDALHSRKYTRNIFSFNI